MVHGTSYELRSADMVLMALTIWREARGESFEGKAAVAHSILNRVARPKWWGQDIHSVLAKKWQYSSLTDPKDPQLTRWPLRGDRSWRESLEVAATVMDGVLPNPVPGADSYHDISIKAPAWAEEKMFVRQIGRLKFYDVDLDYEKCAPAEPAEAD